MLVEHIKAFAEEKNITFELLGDPSNQTAQKYGLVFSFPDDIKKIYTGFGIDLPKHNGDESLTIPIPARFLVDRGGIIRYSEATVDHTVRSEAEDTIAALKELKSKPEISGHACMVFVFSKARLIALPGMTKRTKAISGR